MNHRRCCCGFGVCIAIGACVSVGVGFAGGVVVGVGVPGGSFLAVVMLLPLMSLRVWAVAEMTWDCGGMRSV